jgi:hypothetical protein
MSIDRVPLVAVLLNLVSFTLVLRWFVWPRLRGLDRHRALIPLVAFHWVRSLGVLAAIPGMSGDQHDTEWAIHVAIGDAVTVMLAWLAVAALRARHRAALGAVWLFNLVGFADLINAFRNAVAGGLPVESLGAQTLIIAIGPPALLVGHLAIFAILVARSR